MKKMIAIILAGMSLTMASNAFAAKPVQFEGDVSVKYEKDTAAGQDDLSGVVSTFRLKAETDLGFNWSLYTRLGAQYTSQAGIYDLNPDKYGENKKGALAIDQFGFNYRNDKLAYKLGRQDVTVGTTALLYSRPDSNIGKKFFVDGLTVNGTVGKTDIAAVAAREDNPSGFDNNKLYAVHAGYSPSDSFNWGLTWGRYQAADANTNHWGADGTYHYGKSSLTAEFAKSNSNDKNKAHAVTLNYAFNDRTSAYITGFRVEENASMGQQSDFDYGQHGIHYGISHSLSDHDSLEMVYKDQKVIEDGTKDTSFELSYTRSF